MCPARRRCARYQQSPGQGAEQLLFSFERRTRSHICATHTFVGCSELCPALLRSPLLHPQQPAAFQSSRLATIGGGTNGHRSGSQQVPPSYLLPISGCPTRSGAPLGSMSAGLRVKPLLGLSTLPETSPHVHVPWHPPSTDERYVLKNTAPLAPTAQAYLQSARVQHDAHRSSGPGGLAAGAVSGSRGSTRPGPKLRPPMGVLHHRQHCVSIWQHVPPYLLSLAQQLHRGISQGRGAQQGVRNRGVAIPLQRIVHQQVRLCWA